MDLSQFFLKQLVVLKIMTLQFSSVSISPRQWLEWKSLILILVPLTFAHMNTPFQCSALYFCATGVKINASALSCYLKH